MQFISLQEARKFIPLLSIVPYDLTLASKTRKNPWGIKESGPQNNLKETDSTPSEAVSLSVQGCKGYKKPPQL